MFGVYKEETNETGDKDKIGEVLQGLNGTGRFRKWIEAGDWEESGFCSQ